MSTIEPKIYSIILFSYNIIEYILHLYLLCFFMILLTVPKDMFSSVAIIRIGLPSLRICNTFCTLSSSIFGLPTGCGSFGFADWTIAICFSFSSRYLAFHSLDSFLAFFRLSNALSVLYSSA